MKVYKGPSQTKMMTGGIPLWTIHVNPLTFRKSSVTSMVDSVGQLLQRGSALNAPAPPSALLAPPAPPKPPPATEVGTRNEKRAYVGGTSPGTKQTQHFWGILAWFGDDFGWFHLRIELNFSWRCGISWDGSGGMHQVDFTGRDHVFLLHHQPKVGIWASWKQRESEGWQKKSCCVLHRKEMYVFLTPAHTFWGFSSQNSDCGSHQKKCTYVISRELDLIAKDWTSHMFPLFLKMLWVFFMNIQPGFFMQEPITWISPAKYGHLLSIRDSGLAISVHI